MMNKNIIALAITVTLAAGTLAAQAATYTDIQGNWAQSDIETLTTQKIMTGYNDGLFHPDAWMTRAEFLNMTARTLGLPNNKVNQLTTLKDVSQNAWSFNNVDNQAWISAYPQGVFRPENPIRRVEVLAALAGSLNKPLVSEAEATQILSRFSDADQVPANARRQVATAIQYDLFANEPAQMTMIQPLEPATRAEVAAMLSNLHDNRDIALVQNGNVIAATNPTTMTSTTTTTTPVATTTKTTSMTTTGSTEPAVAMFEGGWQQGNGGTPYRNSADTITEFRNPVIHPVTGVQQLKQANLPANTIFTGTVAKALYSEFNKPGDPVMLILDKTLMGADGTIVAPAGSKVLGHVTNVVSNNQSSDVAQLGVAFTEIVTLTGERIAINGNIASTDGMVRADSPQGVVFSSQRSTAALQREINTSEGALYGIQAGKVAVLETPFVTLGGGAAVTDIDQRTTSNVILGVGDRVQVRLGSAPAGSSSTTTQ